LDIDSNILRLPLITAEPARPARAVRTFTPATRPGNVARVDDYLLERHQLRDRLSTLLDAIAPGRRPSSRIVRAIAREAKADGEHSIRALVELYLGEPTERRQEVARRVLQGLPHALVESAIGSALLSPNLTDAQREKLTSLAGTLANAGPTEAPQRFVQPMQLQYTVVELVEAYLEAIEEARASEPEAVGLVWLRGFRGLPDEFRVPLLHALGQRRDPSFMPVFEIEARNNCADVRRAVAECLGNLQCREALDLALRMEFDQDIMVRYDASIASDHLRRQKRLAFAAPPPTFDRCFCMAVPSSGSAGVLYVVRTPDGSLKFCSLLLDTWHRGVIDVWGNVACDESQLAEVVLAFSAEVANATSDTGRPRRPQFAAISRSEALELIRNSVAVSRARGRRLPAEYPIWERLFRMEQEDEPSSANPDQTNIVDEFVFDLHCAGCTRRIYVNRSRTNVSVSSGYAFCSKCLSRERECGKCGRAFRLGTVSAKRILAAFEDGTCTRCICKAAKTQACS
jgi:hypothetical protein